MLDLPDDDGNKEEDENGVSQQGPLIQGFLWIVVVE